MSGEIPKFSLVKFKTLLQNTRGPAEAINEALHTQDELDAYLASCQSQEKGPAPTTQAVGEEGNFTSFVVGEEGPVPTTQAVGEHPTTLGAGEEGMGHGGWRGPFG